MLLLTGLRGNIFVYQGEELGLPQAHVPYDRLVDPEAIANWPLTLGRDGARTPMAWTRQAPWGGFSGVEPWLPVDPAHLPLSVEAQETDPGSMLHWTRAMIALRKQYTAIRNGAILIRETPEDVLAFERVEGARRLLCVFNLTDQALDWTPDESGAIIASVGMEGPGLPALSGYVLML
jgi:alpha-glucosidase